MQRILLAEDDDSMRGFLERALGKAGYEVLAYSTGVDAFENGIGGVRWRHENHGRIGAGFIDRFFARIKDGKTFVDNSPFSRSHPTHKIGPVVSRL